MFYDVADSSGNQAATKSRFVTVVADNVPPLITLSNNLIIVEQGTGFDSTSILVCAIENSIANSFYVIDGLMRSDHFSVEIQ